MKYAYVYDAVRTPIGSAHLKKGSLYTVRPIDLLIVVLKTIQRRNNLDTKLIEDIVIGCVNQSNEQRAIARYAALEADYDATIPGILLNRLCSSGLDSVNYVSAMCSSGTNELMIAGGIENMSRIKNYNYGSYFNATSQFNTQIVPEYILADLLATINNISRKELDTFALNSHTKAYHAKQDKQKYITPVYDQNKLTILNYDENIKDNLNMKKLEKLNPLLEEYNHNLSLDYLTKPKYSKIETIIHNHTNGNSSLISDGASVILIGSKKIQQKIQLKPKVKILSRSLCATKPFSIIEAAINSSKQALKKASMKITDIDLFEINETFAIIPILFAKKLQISLNKINIHGGTIALGNPISATGPIMLTNAIDILNKKNLNTALITISTDIGMSTSTIVERM